MCILRCRCVGAGSGRWPIDCWQTSWQLRTGLRVRDRTTDDAPPLARARGWRPPVCFSLVSCSSFRNNSPSLFSVVSLALDPCPFAWSLAASRHIRRAAARSLIWMAKRCWPNGGLFRACALFLPLCGSHLCCPTVPYCFAVRKCWQQSPLTLPRCFAFWCWLWGEARVLGMREGGVPFYSCAQLLFLIEASFRLRWDHVFSLRSVRDLLKCFCRFNAVEQGAGLLTNNTCLLYVVTCQRYAHFVLALYSLSFSWAKYTLWLCGMVLLCEALLRYAVSPCLHALVCTWRS